MSAAIAGQQKDASAVASTSTAGVTTSRNTGSGSGQSKDTTAASDGIKDKDITNPATNNQFSHLDGLSPGELRQKLDQTRKELRGYLDKKRKIDQELVRDLDENVCMNIFRGLTLLFLVSLEHA